MKGLILAMVLCLIVGLPPLSHAVGTAQLGDADSGVACADCDSRFVNVVGDGMTGDLTMSNAEEVRFRDSSKKIYSSSSTALYIDSNEGLFIRSGQSASTTGQLTLQSGGWCFTGDTLISTPSNELRIDAIKEGDVVLSYDVHNRKFRHATVTQIFSRLHQGYFIINGKVKVTEEHPFMTVQGWIRAKNLQIGYTLITRSGREFVTSIKYVNEIVNVFNMEVDGTNTYYANGYLVHNKGSDGFPVKIEASDSAGLGGDAGYIYLSPGHTIGFPPAEGYVLVGDDCALGYTTSHHGTLCVSRDIEIKRYSFFTDNIAFYADIKPNNEVCNAGDVLVRNDTMFVCVNNETIGGTASSKAYESITIEVDSNTGAAMRNVFDEDNYGAYDYTEHATNGITYTAADGLFTFGNSGLYQISINAILILNANDEVNITLRDSGTDFYSHDVFVHSAVDPVERSITLLREFSVDDYLEVYIGSLDGIDLVTFTGGTSITVVQIE